MPISSVGGGYGSFLEQPNDLIHISYLRQYRAPTIMMIRTSPPTTPATMYFFWSLEDFKAEDFLGGDLECKDFEDVDL